MGEPTPLRLRLLVRAVIVLGVGLTVASAIAVLRGSPGPHLWALVLTAVVFLLGDTALLHLRFGHDQHSFTWSEVALVVALVTLPTPWVWLIVPLPVAVAHLLAHRAPVKVAFNAASILAGTFLAWSLTAAVRPEGVTSAADPRAWAPLAAGSLAFFVWNGATVSAAVAFSQGLPFTRVYRKGMLLNLLVWLGNTATGILLVAMTAMQPATLLVLPVVFGLLYAAYRSYLRAMQERDTWQTLQDATGALVRVEGAQFADVVLDRSPELFGAEFVELVLAAPGDDVSVMRRFGSQSVERLLGPPEDLLGPWWHAMDPEAGCVDMTLADAGPEQRQELEGLGLEACLVSPLWAHNRLVGSLRIGFRGRVALMHRDIQIFKTFANHVSAAAQNVKLFDEIRSQALHDPLTGLPNRTLLLDRLELAQARSARRPFRVAVLFIDVDRFKVINDSLGHGCGDKLLVEVARRLTQSLRPGDTAARFGGDEFVVLCEEISDEVQALDIADRLAATLSAPIRLGDEDEVVITVSAGVAVATGPHQDATSLLRDADAAMYRAKERGRARCELFDKTVRAQAVARLEMENELRRAIDRRELTVHYQPNVRVGDNRVVGAEALARWKHPTRGMVSPAEFIALAEETTLILPLGALVLEEACRQLAAWDATIGLPEDFYVSVNLSTLQLNDKDLLDRVSRALVQSGIRPRSLCLEITETALLVDAEGALDTLRKLRGLGLRVALDDFGTGYSAFSYLHLLPVDVLKIDQSFVSRLGPDPRDRAIVEGMIELAHALDLTVVAEGVETQVQFDHLHSLGCDVVQGYLLARPGPPDTIEPVLLDLAIAGAVEEARVG